MKEPDARWQTAVDLRDSLQWSLGRATDAQSFTAHGLTTFRLVGASVIVLVLIVCAAVLAGMWTVRGGPQSSENGRIYRLSLLPPTGVTTPVPGLPPDRHFALSPDGERLAFIALTPEGTRMLWVPTADGTAWHVLADTRAAQAPFWSPDSQSIGFFTNAELKRVAAAGGPVQTLCTCAFNGSGTWNRDNLILFSDGRALFHIPASGGTPVSVRVPDTGTGEHNICGHSFSLMGAISFIA